MPQKKSTFGRTTRSLQSGQHGTKKFLRQYGDRLICVRYRKDTRHRRQLTTVELIVEERPLPEPSPKESVDRIVSLQVQFGEIAVGKAVRAAGGIWDSHQKVWKIPYRHVKKLGMLDRIVASASTGDTVQQKSSEQ